MRSFLSYFVRYTRVKRLYTSVLVLLIFLVFIFFNVSVLFHHPTLKKVLADKLPKGPKPGQKPGQKPSPKVMDPTDDIPAEFKDKPVSDNTHTIFDTSDHKEYLTDLFRELIAAQPDFDALPSEYPKAPEMAPWDDRPLLSAEYLSTKYLQVTDAQVEALKKSHALFYAQVTDNTSKIHFPNHVDGDEEQQQGFYIPNSNGIVYVGGGKYSWFALLSIKHLRNIGSKLPVEVYIPTKEEYEEEFCEKILPLLNAKCLKMYEILDIDIIKNSKFEIKGFMLKSLALLLSNFENILLLDADNVPYLNPDILFVSEPYLTNKFVLWPDYWVRTTHPKMYEIQGIDLVEKNLKVKDKAGKLKYTSKEQILKETPLHDLIGTPPDPSCETGQLMISKKDHADVVLLSLYYNIYGPKYYYHLITQWAPGQGDKDTFVVAANLLNSTYYQVKTTVTAIGYHKSNGEFRGTAQGQYSPIDEVNFSKYHAKLLEMYEEDFCVQKGITKEQLKDSKVYQKALEEYQKVRIETLEQFSSEKDETKALKDYFANVFDLKIRIMFVHESTPKFDPLDLIINNQISNEDNNDRIRFYDNVLTDPGYYKFEKMQWENIYEMLCSDDNELRVGMKFIEEQKKHFGDRYNEEKFCKEIQKEIEWIGSKN